MNDRDKSETDKSMPGREEKSNSKKKESDKK